MRIGSYEVLSELGRGGMGVVYRARSPEGRDVAVKVLAATDEEFEREVRLLSSFSLADGFVPVIDTGSERGRRFLVMPFVAGGTLRARLRQGPLPVAEAVSILSSVALAMGRAHERGIVHRDLKPENILFDAEGAPLVADLGLAKHFRRDVLGASKSATASEIGVIAGTVGYMAPEQLDDSKRAGPRADVFALGAILYEALTGKRPFEGTGFLGYTEALLKTAPVRPSRSRREVPRWLDAAVLRALDRKEEARFADAGELARALHAGRTPRRRRVWLALAALIVVPALLAGEVRARAARTQTLAIELVRLAAKKNKARDFGGAFADATRAIELDPRLASAWAHRGGARCNRGDVEGGIRDEDKAIELDPGLALAWEYRGGARMNRGDFAGATVDANRAIELDATFAPAWIVRAGVRLNTSDMEGALADATRAIELDATLAQGWSYRGMARYTKRDLDGAIADLTKALELDSRLSQAWRLRGTARGERGDPDGMIADETRAIELDARDPHAWLERGRARGRKRDLDGAIADLTRALELEPGLMLAWASRGTTRLARDDPDGAIADLSNAIELEPTAWALAQRGSARHTKNDLDGAIADLSRAIELDPELGLAWVERGSARGSRGDVEGALADSSKAIELEPRSCTAWKIRGIARMSQGDERGGIADLERALELAPPGPEAAEIRGLLEEALKHAR